MRFARTLLGALAAVALAACAGEYPQSSVAPASDVAEIIQALYVDIFWWTMIILALVWVVLAYVLVRYRARPDSPSPKQVRGHMGLEIAWTIGPALIVLAIAIPSIRGVFETQRGDPEESLVVEVVGHQFWWEFRYPDYGIVTANELHLPVDQPVSLRLHSADVIHSFWVPQLGGKRDANPLVATPTGVDSKYNWLHFTALETGVYMGQCAEFCGESHSLMGMRVVVESESDFARWVQDWQAGPDTVQALPADPQAARVEQGRTAFYSSTCIACHSIEGTNAQGVLGPNLTLLGRRSRIGAGWLENTQANLEAWIRAPQDVKPGALMPGVAATGGNWPATSLSEDQVTAIAAYLSSLR
jgi:cytochrome c oxidase subunit II